ncbi:glycoside hydrolase family 2 protein [Fulvivirga sp. M361]|uniref:beta-mannosidase n=1 Tax=Fulvivirga sp. M361 TaxID=2594266 RepID=UPI0016264B35|nr:glycoside hydrolase family 2 protein [Fulvivirga sp. M361]
MKHTIHDNWQFQQTGKEEWMKARVPGTVHTDLLTNTKIEDPFYRTNEHNLQWIEDENWTYRTTFGSDDLSNYDEIELVLEGLDTYADVYLNDTLVLKTYNMFREWRRSVKELLRKGENQLVIQFRSPMKEVGARYDTMQIKYFAGNDRHEKKLSVFTRKAPYHYGWDWGPRFVTSGIWKPVYLEAWSTAKLSGLAVVQKSLTDESAVLEISHEVQSTRETAATLQVEVDRKIFTQEVILKKGENTTIVQAEVLAPKRWWPNGLGAPNLYEIKTELIIDNAVTDTRRLKTGLRTVEIKQLPDSAGRSFEVWVNDQPVFMKGGNYIPMDNFTPRVSENDYRELIENCKNTNMNMLRVWGGGIYERDVFYELCDENGILVWQDFMFACSMYPGDTAFLENVRQEAIDNIKRLRNHPSIALWCGNNEIEEAWHHWGLKERSPNYFWEDYKKLFHELLSEMVATYDPQRYYHRSSPTSNDTVHMPRDSRYGDIHYWGVWHGEEPFSSFLEHKNTGRFVSEYGFQSFPSLATIKTFAEPHDFDIASEVMKSHQKNNGGNRRIKNYMEKYYGVPDDFSSFLYVSQLLQAEAMKVAVEHHRRMMPYTMGSLYWQINDCWPGASWAGLDYYGNWKALQYYTRDFFSPVLVSPKQENDRIDIYAVSDHRKVQKVALDWYFLTFQGDTLKHSSQHYELQANHSDVIERIPLGSLSIQGNETSSFIYVKLSDEKGNKVSDNRLFFTEYKKLRLTDARVKLEVMEKEGKHTVKASSAVLAKNVYLTVVEGNGRFEANFFDLNPGEIREIAYVTDDEISLENLQNRIKVMTLNGTRHK